MTKEMNIKRFEKYYRHHLLVPAIHLMNGFIKWPFCKGF